VPDAVVKRKTPSPVPVCGMSIVETQRADKATGNAGDFVILTQDRTRI
jgi:hypothetical protein